MKIQILILALLMGSAACTLSSSNDNNGQSGPYYPPKQSHDSSLIIDQVLDSAKISCSGPCPEGVGLVVTMEESARYIRRGQCSGTLIDEDIVMTNSHCIPDSIKSGAIDCSEAMGFLLPGSYSTPAKCTSVLMFTKRDDKRKDGPDLAFFRVDRKLTSAPKVMDKSGISDGQIFNIYAVDPVSDSRIEGVIREDRCVALVKGSDPDLGPSTLISGCTVIHGNSGTAMFNSDGKISGVIYGKYENTFFFHGATVTGIGSNLACIKPVSPRDPNINQGCVRPN